MRSRLLFVVLLLAALCPRGLEAYNKTWLWYHEMCLWSGSRAQDKRLSDISGAHTLALAPYWDEESQKYRLWSTIVANFVDRDYTPTDERIRARELKDLNVAAGGDVDVPVTDDAPLSSCDACVTVSGGWKIAAWARYDEENDIFTVRTARQQLTTHDGPWDAETVHGLCSCGDLSIAAHEVSGNRYVYLLCELCDADDYYRGLCCIRSTDDGASWTYDTISYWSTREFQNPAVAAEPNGPNVYVAYDEFAESQTVSLMNSDDCGLNWSGPPLPLSGDDDLSWPSVAATGGGRVFVFWSYMGKIYYRYSLNGGDDWIPEVEDPPTVVNLPYDGLRYDNAKVSVCFPNQRYIQLVCWVRNLEKNWGSVAATWGWADASGQMWHNPCWLASASDASWACWQPDLATYLSSQGYVDTLAYCVWADSREWPTNGARVFRSLARYRVDFSPVIPPVHTDNTGTRLIIAEEDGLPWAARGERSQVMAGPVLGTYPAPVVVDVGERPAMAVDGAGSRWVVYLRSDTVWCRLGTEEYEPVFCGSGSAVPGQPSIVCYSEQASAGYVGSIVFPVYDTTGGTSKIMYARVDTSAVVLDTIESVANLRDSLPCISIYKTDTLLATFQHGDSVLSVMLADYGPGTTGRPGAWSSPNLVTAHGYHPMSAFDGSVLNCVWTGKGGDNYSINRATNDLSGGMFGSWTQSATPGDTSAYEKNNPVYAGVGVSCWQQKGAGGKWVIRGKVRGDTVTFVANDTDAYHPHAVAESSAVSPSIDQVRCHILYTAGVTFEVDSGVYDTGEARYKCESFNVSHAGSDATKSNNGAKLLRKVDEDSLFAVYTDLDDAVMYAWSAAGDSWQRAVMATGRDYPAIAEDSSGKRWVVMTKPIQAMYGSVQEAYYRSGSSWVGPETLYTNAVSTLGPASLAGASSTTSGIAYAAFLTTSGMSKSLILAKFNGSKVSTYTVATGSSLGDPVLTVEPYSQDSDRVHVTWADDGEVKYRMDKDGRGVEIAGNWTSTVNLSNTEDPSVHSFIAADREQVVVAWAEGNTADIYSRKRSTDSAYNNWEAAINLSNTASNASDWPVIAMGDTVVVAWEEQRSETDHDILACINFGDTVNIADNATMSSYPHVLFQNQTSGDTAIPYLHTVWSEAPEARYYEVGYNKLNLKQTGEGQQSAGKTTIPMKPALNACRPNPFRDRTQISYQLPTAGNVSLRIYDVTGRTVRTLQNGFQKPGAYSVNWDSRDSRGRLVPHGVYFYRLDTKGFRDVKKAVVTR